MSVVINLPTELNISSFEVSMIVASKLFSDGKLSSGQAAEVVGLSKRAFIELLGKYETTVFGISDGDLLNDLTNA